MQILPFDNMQQIETTAVLKKTAQATRYLAELKGVALSIPNESILINTLVLQEAKNSSEIENIITTHDELFKITAYKKNKVISKMLFDITDLGINLVKGSVQKWQHRHQMIDNMSNNTFILPNVNSFNRMLFLSLTNPKAILFFCRFLCSLSVRLMPIHC